MKLKINILKIVFAILAISTGAFSASTKKDVIQKKSSFACAIQNNLASKIKLLKKHKRPILATTGALAVFVGGSVLLSLGLKPKRSMPVQIRSQKELLDQAIENAQSAEEVVNILAKEKQHLDPQKKRKFQELCEQTSEQTYKRIIKKNIVEHHRFMPGMRIRVFNIEFDNMLKELEEASRAIKTH